MEDYAAKINFSKRGSSFGAIKVAAIAFLFFTISVFAWYWFAAYGARGVGESREVVIVPGESARMIGADLAAQKVIQSELAFRLFLKLHGGATGFQSGSFKLEIGSSVSEVVARISSPRDASEIVLRVIEGWTLEDIAREVERLGIGKRDEFLKLTGLPAIDYRKESKVAPSIDWKKEFPILADKPAYVSLEGYLFPDTYRFAYDAKPEDVVRKLLKEFTLKFNDEMLALAKEKKQSVFEVVTMASILEKEVNGDVDRAKVSDLLFRRNEINWALQCDSTVKYANQKYDETPFTTSADRATNSEYNTYMNPGLPLGPISNPGLVSLMAALKPMKNEAWYFLTTPDGEVKYAKSLEEHNDNKRYMR